MATSTSTTIPCKSDSTGSIRAWAGFIFSALLAGGWIRTSDTGQTDTGSLPAATTTSQSCGYQVWKLSDTLSGSAPVFVKWEVGSGGTADTQAQVWVTIGTGSDGAGNITGTVLARTALSDGTVAPGPSTSTCYSSVGTGYCAFAMFSDGWGSGMFIFSLERTKDALGNDTATGLLLTSITKITASAGAATVQLFQAVPFSGSWLANQSSVGASLPSGSTFTVGAAIGVSPLRHFAGGTVNPGVGLMAYLNGDTAAGNVLSMAAYGTSHSYLTLGATDWPSNVDGLNTNAVLMMRYE